MQERGPGYQHENSCTKNVPLASLENQLLNSASSYFHSLFSFVLASVGELTAVSADKYFIASLFFWRSSQAFLFIVLHRIDNLECFTSVNTSTVGVFYTEAKKIAFLVTVSVSC